MLLNKVRGAVCAVLPSLLVVGAAWADSTEDKSKNADVAAFVNGSPITLAELDEIAINKDMKLAQALYDARAEALDQVILNRVLSKEASEQGMTVEDFIAKRVAGKVTPVTDAEVQSFFESNKGRMGNRTLEQMSDQIKAYLEGNRERLARETLIAEIKEKQTIKVVLDPPRIKLSVAAHEPAKGPANAKVTIVEYSEFQCPFCSRVGPTIKQIMDEYGDKVRIVFRHFPLGMHNRAIPAAEAAQCAHDQGKFWEYHDKLFENQRALADENLKQYAADLGLDTEKFNSCYDAGKHRDDVKKMMDSGTAAGVTGTPAFFINGRFLSGAQPFDAFKTIIDNELSRG